MLNRYDDEKVTALFFASSRLAPIKAIGTERITSSVVIGFKMCVILDTKLIGVAAQIHPKPGGRNTKVEEAQLSFTDASRFSKWLKLTRTTFGLSNLLSKQQRRR
ncbi:hypothetical protein DINM_005127 [Dirofilaria immitis]|nr:hypothetical protein [Dirofilaria immitis]